MLELQNIHLYAIRGNHDDPSYFHWNAQEYKSISFVPDYSILSIDDHKILCVGGAISLDRSSRTDGVNYWKDETFEYRADKLEELDLEEITTVVTHAAPLGFPPYGTGELALMYGAMDPALHGDHLKERAGLQKLFNYLLIHAPNMTDWLYGHYHIPDVFQATVGSHKTVTARALNIDEIVQL